jgi:hypothetical protein
MTKSCFRYARDPKLGVASFADYGGTRVTLGVRIQSWEALEDTI